MNQARTRTDHTHELAGLEVLPDELLNGRVSGHRFGTLSTPRNHQNVVLVLQKVGLGQLHEYPLGIATYWGRCLGREVCIGEDVDPTRALRKRRVFLVGSGCLVGLSGRHKYRGARDTCSDERVVGDGARW